MQALVFDGALRVDAVPDPRPRSGDALIRVALAGICGTDLEIARGYKGFNGVLGHEFVGEVVACDDATWIGQRVCGEINVWCGRCAMCHQGLHTHCLERAVVGMMGWQGAFAEYLTLPVQNLHAVPDGVADQEAVFTEPLAAAFEILDQVDIRAFGRVAVLGDGRLGLLCALVLAFAGARPLVVGRHADKLKIVVNRGLDVSLASDSGPGTDFDLVVEATGSMSGFTSAVAMLRPRGTLVLKSTTANAGMLDLSPVVVKELTVLGSRCGPFNRALRALAEGDIACSPLIDRIYPLSQGVEAMQRAATPGVLKVLLQP